MVGGGTLDDVTFDDEPCDGGRALGGKEPPDNGKPPSDGSGNDDESNPFEENVDQAIMCAKGDPNKVHHIFENPSHDHCWYVTGLDDEGNWDLIRQTMYDNQGDIESAPDSVPDRVKTNFGIYTIVTRYIIVDGALRIADAWVIL